MLSELEKKIKENGGEIHLLIMFWKNGAG
jgi:hypothetical protein